MINPVFHRADALHAVVEIPIKTSQISLVRSVLNLYGVPQILPGGQGWQFSDGGIEISGSLSAVEKVTEAILFALNGPKFQSADKLYSAQKQGAMSQ